jgi:hypothetical protein
MFRGPDFFKVSSNQWPQEPKIGNGGEYYEIRGLDTSNDEERYMLALQEKEFFEGAHMISGYVGYQQLAPSSGEERK